MSLPCFELGGGGGFLIDIIEVGSAVVPRRSSSETSCDVRGDSYCGSCIGSIKDWRETEEASVLLPLSSVLCCA